MTHSFSKYLISMCRFRHLGWKVLALTTLLFVSLAIAQFGVFGRARPAHETTTRARYDLALIDADATYYERVDASRLYQMAPIPTGLQRHEELRIIGEPYRLAVPQSWLEQPLTVMAKPGRPVTFVALDSGKFANGDISITIKADGNGFASTSFFVTDEGRYRVLAGSPENAGPAAFYVHCMSRAMRDELRSGRYAERRLAEAKANKERQAAAAAEMVERIRRLRASK